MRSRELSPYGMRSKPGLFQIVVGRRRSERHNPHGELGGLGHASNPWLALKGVGRRATDYMSNWIVLPSFGCRFGRRSSLST